MDKTQLRKTAINRLKDMSDNEKQNYETALIENLLASPMWKKANTIGVTVSKGFEWNTKPIIEAGWNQGKTICVPKCIPKEKKLQFYELRHFNQLEIVYYNLLEPNPSETIQVGKTTIDLLIVPGLLFDKQGYRIGFGGGYYDRFLSTYTNETVSLVHTMQLIDHVPSEPFDIPVNHIITEKG